MKAIIIILAIFFSNGILLAQDSTLTLSKFEKFYSKTGKMTRTDHGLVGEIRDISVNVYRVTDLETGDTSKAVNVYQNISFLLSPISLGYLYIDFEEVPGVARALDYYRQEIKKGRPKYQPYFQYVTSNDVVVSCSYREMGIFSGWSVGMSRRYSQLKSTVAGSAIIIRNKDIDDLARMLDECLLVKFK